MKMFIKFIGFILGFTVMYIIGFLYGIYYILRDIIIVIKTYIIGCKMLFIDVYNDKSSKEILNDLNVFIMKYFLKRGE